MPSYWDDDGEKFKNKLPEKRYSLQPGRKKRDIREMGVIKASCDLKLTYAFRAARLTSAYQCPNKYIYLSNPYKNLRFSPYSYSP